MGCRTMPGARLPLSAATGTTTRDIERAGGQEADMTEIVVGIDGSESGTRAVSWALDEAVHRGLPVRLVHVMPRWAFEMPETGRHASIGRWAREEASDLLTRTWEDARRQKPGVKVVSQFAAGRSSDRPAHSVDARGHAGRRQPRHRRVLRHASRFGRSRGRRAILLSGGGRPPPAADR